MAEGLTSKELKVTLLSPARTLMLNQKAKLVLLTGSEGQIEILPGHINMVGTLETGVFRIEKDDGKKITGFISTGFFEVHENSISVTAETLEVDQEIDVDRAKRAESKARDKLREGGLSQDNFKKYQLKLQRSLVRQQLLSKRDQLH